MTYRKINYSESYILVVKKMQGPVLCIVHTPQNDMIIILFGNKI